MNLRIHLWIIAALFIGIVSGIAGFTHIITVATGVSVIFVRFLQLLSLPIIFLAIVSTLSNLGSWAELRRIGQIVFKYTLSTTLMAAAIGLGLLLLFGLHLPSAPIEGITDAIIPAGTYFEFLAKVFPDNAVTAFSEGNVIGIAFIAFILGTAIVSLPLPQKQPLQTIFSSLFAALLKVAVYMIQVMPIGIWAFTTLLVHEWLSTDAHGSLIWYALAVLGANFIQGLIVLPLLLKAKGLSPIATIKAMMPALTMAFFTKSSSSTMPLTLGCMKKNLGIRPHIANTAVPLCSVINMNGCAAFILITVIYVSAQHGIVFSPLEMLMWIGLATVAAIGNAGVPMGCYFLTSAFLLSMDVPLTTLGLILPLYAFIDMVETALNVWSDCCVTAVVDKELLDEELLLEAAGKSV